MELHDSLDEIGRRLIKLSSSPPVWATSKTGYRSVLVNDLYVEWSIHFLACYGTLTSAQIEVSDWIANAPSNALLSKEELSALTLILLDQAVSALEADNLGRFLKLTLSVIESAAKLLGFAFVIEMFEFGGIFDKIKAILNIEQAEFTVTDDLLSGIELSLQAMLTSALFVEAQVGTLTGRFHNDGVSRAKLIEMWKAPVIQRIRAQRLAFQDAGMKSGLLKLPEGGYWQPGLD